MQPVEIKLPHSRLHCLACWHWLARSLALTHTGIEFPPYEEPLPPYTPPKPPEYMNGDAPPPYTPRTITTREKEGSHSDQVNIVISRVYSYEAKFNSELVLSIILYRYIFDGT